MANLQLSRVRARFLLKMSERGLPSSPMKSGGTVRDEKTERRKRRSWRLLRSCQHVATIVRRAPCLPSASPKVRTTRSYIPEFFICRGVAQLTAGAEAHDNSASGHAGCGTTHSREVSLGFGTHRTHSSSSGLSSKLESRMAMNKLKRSKLPTMYTNKK